jgi:F0F1-type ATP synthase membrane subunit b/b'
VGAILDQLGLDVTFFYQLAIFAVLFVVLGQLYFKPFLKLFQARHEKTIKDRESAERLMHDANLRLEEYKRKLSEERASARREYDAILDQAKKEEVESVSGQREKLRLALEADVESLAQTIAERLLSRKA